MREAVIFALVLFLGSAWCVALYFLCQRDDEKRKRREKWEEIWRRAREP